MTRRRWLIVLLVFLALLAAHRLWDYVELRALVAQIQTVRDKGEPVTMADALGWYDEDRGEAWRTGGHYYIAAGMATSGSRAYDQVPAFREWLAGGRDRPSPDAIARLQRDVDEIAQPLGLADRAAQLRFVQLPPGTEYNYRASHLWGLVRRLNARTWSLALAGDGDAAVTSVLSTVAARRVLREIRSAQAQQLDLSAVLSLSAPSASALERLQRALAVEVSRDAVLEGLLLDRARTIEYLWRRHFGYQPGAPQYRSRGFAELLGRPLHTRRTRRVVRLWNDLVEAGRRPWPDRIEAMDAAAASALISDPRSPYGAPPSRSPDSWIADSAGLVAVAVERYRRERGVGLPQALSDLVPEYLAAVPLDPYTGGPVLYMKSPSSYTIYSVGPDRRDDGGDLTSELTAAIAKGFGPRNIRGRDLGVQIRLDLR